MKPMDEMDRSIQLRAEEVAYKAVLGPWRAPPAPPGSRLS